MKRGRNEKEIKRWKYWNCKRERERELYSREISFVKHAKKYIKIDKDRLLVKAKILLQNSLSFLRVEKVIETKDKYAWWKE